MFKHNFAPYFVILYERICEDNEFLHDGCYGDVGGISALFEAFIL